MKFHLPCVEEWLPIRLFFVPGDLPSPAMILFCFRSRWQWAECFIICSLIISFVPPSVYNPSYGVKFVPPSVFVFAPVLLTFLPLIYILNFVLRVVAPSVYFIISFFVSFAPILLTFSPLICPFPNTVIFFITRTCLWVNGVGLVVSWVHGFTPEIKPVVPSVYAPTGALQFVCFCQLLLPLRV